MSTIRHFSASREIRKGGLASQQMRLELQKKGKTPASERYKKILLKRLDEHKAKALNKTEHSFGTPFAMGQKRALSKRAENALKEIAAKKAAKEAKAERQRVVVEPRMFPNGHVVRKGQIFDVAGNIVARVDTKNGNMLSMTGWKFGKYKPKSIFTNLLMQDAINKYSPYFINQRKLQMLKEQGVEVVNVHGSMLPDSTTNVYGGQTDVKDGLAMGPRQNIGVTSWGARSDNVWGTFADNAWGNSMDNVWGMHSTNVWGGIGGGSLWGSRGPNIWGTGNGRNYLRGITSIIKAFFGFSDRKNRDKLRALRAGSGGSSSGGSSAVMRSARR